MTPEERWIVRLGLRWRMSEIMRMMKYHAGGYNEKRKREYAETKVLYEKFTQEDGAMQDRSFCLIIKGTIEEAKVSLLAHDLALKTIARDERFDTCRCLAEGSIDNVVEWFCENPKMVAPYPSMSLMWYGFADNGDMR